MLIHWRRVILTANSELHPKFTFDFLFTLEFDDLFTFDVQASPISVPIKEPPDVTTTDYRLNAEFHQKIRGHLASKINKMFDEKARQEAKDAEVAQEEIEKERQVWQANVEVKQAELDAAYAAWTSKSNESHVEYDRIVEEDKAKAAALLQKLDESAKLKTSVADAQAKLSAANNE